MTGYYDAFSTLTDEEKLLKAKEMRDEAWYANIAWLSSAEEAYKFKAGDQWSEDEKYKLSLQGRTPMIWNYVHPAVELVMGINSQNPVRVYPYPVEKSDAFLCEVLEDLVKHIDENQVDAATEEDNMFEAAITTGCGDVVVDVGPDPSNPEEILFYESSMDAYEVLVDPKSKRADLKDARYISYEKWVTAEDFKVRYPAHIKDMEEIFTANTSGASSAISNVTSRDSINSYTSYGETPSFEYFDSQNKRILVTHMEYKEAYKRYYYIDKDNGAIEFDKKQLPDIREKVKNLGGQIQEIYDTKVMWMHYIYDRILWEGDSPVYKKNFSLVRQTAYTDKSKRQYSYYGLVKLMLDPQRECNRRWMHALRILGAQGVGVMAEIDAFHDLEQARSSWSDPDSITFVAKGRMNAVKEKSVPQFPDAPIRMGEMNKQAMKDITGINPDLQGTAQQRREPGINLKLRQKQGLTMLSRLFSNYTKARKEILKRKIEVISRFMPDKQIRKILGETEKYTFQDGNIIDQARDLSAPIRKIKDLEYNIRTEDAPGGVNKMLTELSTFMDMMEKKFPVNPTTVIDKLDLSPIEKEDWKKYISDNQQAQQQAQQQEIEIKKAELDSKLKVDLDRIAVENRKIDVLTEKTAQDDSRIRTLEDNKITLSDDISQREIAVKIAELQSSDRAKIMDILKWLDEIKLKQQTAPPAIRVPNGASTSQTREGY